LQVLGLGLEHKSLKTSLSVVKGLSHCCNINV